MHVPEQEFRIVPASNLIRGEQQVFISCLRKQLFQILLECLSLQPPTHILLYGNCIRSLLLIIECLEIPWSVTPIQTLNQNTWTVSFEDSLESVDIHFQVELVLLSTPLMTIVRDMQLHEFIESSESVTEGSVFNYFFIRYDEVVKCSQPGQRVYHEVSVTRNCTDGIRE